MYFSARSALLASCLAISVQALPVTYSVVDVDGGASANGAPGSNDQPATVYHTVTKSQDVEEPEPTTVSVSVTIVETQQASATSISASGFSALAPERNMRWKSRACLLVKGASRMRSYTRSNSAELKT